MNKFDLHSLKKKEGSNPKKKGKKSAQLGSKKKNSGSEPQEEKKRKIETEDFDIEELTTQPSKASNNNNNNHNKNNNNNNNSNNNTNNNNKNNKSEKRNFVSNFAHNNDVKREIEEKSGIILGPQSPLDSEISLVQRNQRKLIVVLDGAYLQSVRIGANKGYELLNSDDHKSMLASKGKDFGLYRPDIAHQCLLTLLDSPLNKAGLLKVYIRTSDDKVLELHPSIRIPRTYKRFSGLIVQLLQKLYIRSTDGKEKLMKIVKSPVTSHLPSGCHKIGLSHKATKLVDIQDYVFANFKNENVVMTIGCFAHGAIQDDYVEESISISQYPLSGAVVCGRVTMAFEKLWHVL